MTNKDMTMYGTNVGPGYMGRPRDLIGSVENTPNGNVILRVGEENPGGTWPQTGHVVLTPEEALAFADRLRAAVIERNFIGS